MRLGVAGGAWDSTSLAGAPGGGGAGEGDYHLLGAEEPDPAIRAYLKQLKRRIYAHWDLPAGADPAGARHREVLLRFAIAADGSLRSLAVDRSSGDAALDAAAHRAVADAAPFPPFPRELARRALPVRAPFVY